MTSEAWLPWAIVGLCILAGLLISLAMTVYGPATAGLAGLGRVANGGGNAEEIPQLDGGARFFANALRVGSLLAGAASFSVALEGRLEVVYAIVAGSGAALIAGLSASVVSSAIGHRFPYLIRPAMYPVAFALRIGALISGV